MTTADPLAGVPASLWEAAARAPRRLLMLDYDGTLAPLHLEPARAVPSSAALARLDRIAASRRTRLAIVSGRPIESLLFFLPGLDAKFVGVHGWERWHPGMGAVRGILPAAAAGALAEATAAAAAVGLADCVEIKHASIMLHVRGLPTRDAAARIEKAASLWGPHAGPEGPLDLRPAHGGLELRARGRDKGAAVRELRSAEPAGTLPVYLGDDESDEDAFREVADSGFGIRVGAPAARTRATGTIPSCEAVEAFLERWLGDVEAGDALARPAGGAPSPGPEGVAP